MHGGLHAVDLLGRRERSWAVGEPMKMNSTETTQSRKGALAINRKPGRLFIYEALFNLNQEFEQVLETLERLERLSLFRPRLRREFVRACRVTVEETRAWANFELTHILHGVEERDWSRFGRLRRQLENPDDVLVAEEKSTLRKAGTKKRALQGGK